MSRSAVDVDMNNQDDNTKSINVLIKDLENALSVGEEADAIQHVKLLTNLLKRYNNNDNAVENSTKKLKLSIKINEEDTSTMKADDCNRLASVYVPYAKPIHYQTNIKNITRAVHIKKLALKTINVDEGLMRWELGRFKIIKDTENILNNNDGDDEPLILYPFPINSDLKKSKNDLEMTDSIKYNLRKTKAREMRIASSNKVKNSIDLTKSSSDDENLNSEIGVPGPSGINQASDALILDQCIVINDDDIDAKMSPQREMNHVDSDNNNNTNEETRLLTIPIIDDILIKSEPFQENQSYIINRSNEYNELKKLEDCEIVPNFTDFECPICFTIIGSMDGVVLRDCLHQFCWDCLKVTAKMSTGVEIKCPYRDNDYSCEATLQVRELKALLSPEDYEKHIEKSINHAENSAGLNEKFHCQTPNCTAWCFFDEDANNFVCPVCEKINCLVCRAIHETRTCLEYQDDLFVSQNTDEQAKRSSDKIRTMLQSGEGMHCPKCGVVVMKKDGCDYLTCSMCGTGICWATKQARWGPGGPGDNSGGCRCKVNGNRCHPNCSNCH